MYFIKYFIIKFLRLVFTNPTLLYYKIKSILYKKSCERKLVKFNYKSIALITSNKPIRILPFSSDIITCIFNTIESGGSKLYLTHQIKKKKEDSTVILIESNNFRSWCSVKVSYKGYYIEFRTNQVFKLLEKLNIKTIIINHLLFNKNDKLIQNILKLKSLTCSQLHVVVHDYFYICPTINLLNHKNIFCGVPTDPRVCNNCLNSFSGKSYCNGYIITNKTRSIVKWRDKFLPLLLGADKIIVPSNYVMTLFSGVYPELEQKIEIQEHELNYLLKVPQQISYVPFVDKTFITIGVLGSIGPHKGSTVVYEMIDIARRDKLNIDWVVIGDIHPPKKYKNLKITGSYTTDNLFYLINQYKPDIFICPSVCPETFCYTASEIMHIGLPLISFNLGAQAERISNYSRGVLVNNISANSMLDAVINLGNDYK